MAIKITDPYEAVHGPICKMQAEVHRLSSVFDVPLSQAYIEASTGFHAMHMKVIDRRNERAGFKAQEGIMPYGRDADLGEPQI